MSFCLYVDIFLQLSFVCRCSLRVLRALHMVVISFFYLNISPGLIDISQKINLYGQCEKPFFYYFFPH